MSRRALPATVADPVDLGLPGPAPPRPVGSAALLLLARVLLWALVGLGALRGLLGAPERPDQRPVATAVQPAATQAASGVAAAFLREYLTVDADRAGRARRLRRFGADGADVARAVLPPPGASQYADQVVPAGVGAAAGRLEVTLLAHVLQLGPDGYRDRGTLAFVVPLVGGPGGLAVQGIPRPVAPPLAPGLALRRPAPAGGPTGATARRTLEGLGRRAAVALLADDAAALARLGGGVPPETRPLPAGWRGGEVAGVELTGPAGTPTVQVLVRATAPDGGADYLVPIRVELAAGPGGPAVRRVDASGR
jgi:hypothetical protein